MGRPIKKSWFGDDTSPGYQIKITGKVYEYDGITVATITDGYIVAQKGTRRYVISDGTDTGTVTLKNTLTSGSLSVGEGFISATPFGGSALAVHKLTQYRVSIYDTVDSSTSTISNYTWSTVPAATAGQADVIDTATGTPVTALGTVVDDAAGGDDNAVVSVTITNGGSEYASVPTVTFSAGTGSTATGTAVLTNGEVTDVIITDGGSYLDSELPVTVTFSAP